MDLGPSMSSGSLRTKISLKGGYSQLSLVCPFYGMKQELPEQSPILGSDDLLAYYDLSGAYNRYCTKKLRDDLASFLPQVVGTSYLNMRCDNTCSLRKLVESPPITGKEIVGLSASQMVGFKLAPGPVSENFRLFNLSERNSQSALPLGDAIADPASSAPTTSYQEFGQNFNDPEEVKSKHRVKYKRTLDDWEDGESEKKAKKPRTEEKEKKEKKQKKNKKEKKKKKNTEDEPKRAHRKEEAMPFF